MTDKIRVHTIDAVHGGTTAVIFADFPGGIDHGGIGGLGDNDHPQYLLVTDIDDTPVNGELAQPISSNWAFDHAALLTGVHGLAITAGQVLTVSASATINGGTHSGTNTGDQSSVSGNAGSVTVVDAGGDTTTWPLLGIDQTGSLSPATDAGLTYNSDTNALTTTTFIGALQGNASTATTAGTVTGATQAAITSAANLATVGTITSGTWNGTLIGVASGGTGRVTGTTAYALIATGTTATGVQQTLAAGATNEMLVGGGASALPVWTAATGSGSPVRSQTPTLTTPVIGIATGTSLAVSGGSTVGSATLDATYRQHIYGAIDKATTTPEEVSFIGSSDATSPLGLRVTVGNHATAGSRYVDIQAVEPGVAQRTLRLNGANCTVGTTGILKINNTVNSVSPTSPNRTITIDVGGTTYYLHAKTTND